MSNFKRYAIIRSADAAIAAYLPGNYTIAAVVRDPESQREVTVIEGRDNSGWTLDGYVLPRLASGLHFGQEIDLSHSIMMEF